MSQNLGCWFEIYVQDMERAKKFYETVLGVTLQRLPKLEPEMWTFPMDPTGPGISGALVHLPDVPSGGNSTLIYFGCKDCAVEEARVVPAGGKVCHSKFSIGDYGHIALVMDTEGNMIGLHSPPNQGAE